jgi:hypothetical protein
VQQVQRCRCKKGAEVTRWGVGCTGDDALSADVLVDVEFQQRLSLSLWRCKGKAGAEEQVQRCRGAEVQRCRGAMVQWCNGAEVLWCCGTEVQRCIVGA